MQHVRALNSVQGALIRCALAIAIGDPAVPLAYAHAPSLAPTPTIFPPSHSLLPSEEDIAGLHLSFDYIGSSGVVELPSAPVGPDAQ